MFTILLTIYCHLPPICHFSFNQYLVNSVFQFSWWKSEDWNVLVFCCFCEVLFCVVYALEEKKKKNLITVYCGHSMSLYSISTMTLYCWNICKLWCSGKDLTSSARGPRFESGVGNFFFPVRSIIITLWWLELGCDDLYRICSNLPCGCMLALCGPIMHYPQALFPVLFTEKLAFRCGKLEIMIESQRELGGGGQGAS